MCVKMLGYREFPYKPGDHPGGPARDLVTEDIAGKSPAERPLQGLGQKPSWPSPLMLFLQVSRLYFQN